jgi:nicotinamide-nucleotide amidase
MEEKLSELDALLEEEVGCLLRAKNLTLAVAESCTGGLIGHRLTNIPGSSQYFLAGIVAYSNMAKESVLKVEHSLLEKHGAVSAEVAAGMAAGARSMAGADASLAVTGVAGPGGGGAGKPVGLVYVAVEGPWGTKVAKYTFDGDRASIKHQTSEAALALLKEALLGD